MRRLLITLIAIFALLAIALGVYVLLFSNRAHLTVRNGIFSTSGTRTVPATTATTVTQNAGTQVAPGLIQITSTPVSAGVAAFDVAPSLPSISKTASTSSSTPATPIPSNGDIYVNYIDRQSGNVYQYAAHARTLTRISNKTLPGIQTASWTPDGSTAFVQFLAAANNTEQLDTYALPSDGQGGFFLESNLAQVLMNGTKSLFTLSAGTNSSIGSVSNTDGTNIQTVFTSPISSLIVHSAGKGWVAATKAASELDGYAFSINSTGGFVPMIGPLRGLSVLPSPDGQSILYTYVDGSNLHMRVLNLTSGTNTELPLSTLSEKCVWTGDSSTLYCAVPTAFSGNLPDDWYQGAVSFNDRIWHIDLTSHLATLVIDPSSSGNSIDAVNLTLDPSGQVLVFRNKKDSSLWSYNL